jgi:2-oxoglutarate ferredoxin oxidoreductase subunit gamma
MAAEMGNIRFANMILLGAWAAASGVVTPEQLAQALADHLPQNKQRFVQSNQEALRRGVYVAQEQLNGVMA